MSDKDDRSDKWVTKAEDLSFIALTPEAEAKAKKADPRIRQLRKLIGKESRDEDLLRAVADYDRYCRHLDLIGDPAHWYRPSTKADKEQAATLAAALRTLKRKLASDGGKLYDQAIRRALLEEADAFLVWAAQMEQWAARFEAFASWELRGDKSPEEEPAQKGRSLLPPPKPLRQASDAKTLKMRRAAAVAAELLSRCGVAITVSDKTNASGERRVSKFCRAAAIVYGDPRARFTAPCRWWLERRNSRSRDRA